MSRDKRNVFIFVNFIYIHWNVKTIYPVSLRNSWVERGEIKRIFRIPAPASYASS